jgi:hypothetical protein
VRHVRAWVCFFVPLWWLWQLLSGEWNHYEWIAGAAAAAVAATIGEVARTAAGVRARVPLACLRTGWSAFPVVFTDFGRVLWGLVRRPSGTFRRHPGPADGDDPESTGIRVWTNLLANYSPNAYVVGLDDGEAVLHDLFPARSSEKPA